MQRQIVLDTETTGLDPNKGHRLIEIGCVEIINRRRTGQHWHVYLNPMRPVDPGAMKVHGLTDEFLSDKPLFSTQVDAFLAFVKGAELIIHNAPFDVGFLDAELAHLQQNFHPLAHYCTILDSLTLAREKHPGQANSLDALCRRYEVDASRRALHGALLDAELLAEVYLRMTGGQTELFSAEDAFSPSDMKTTAAEEMLTFDVPVVPLSPDEHEAHATFMAQFQQKEKA